MTHHILVGVYDAEADAAAAVRDLIAAEVPSDSIRKHTKADFGGTDFSSANAITHKQGFWGRFFSTNSMDESAGYHRSIERGSTVVTAAVPDEDVERISAILERHSPIDVSQEASEAVPSEDSSGDPTIARTDGTLRVRRYVVQTTELETDSVGKPTP